MESAVMSSGELNNQVFEAFLLNNLLFNRQLTEIRSKEALEKEKTRRDYERLRMELDEVAKQEKKAKESAGKVIQNIQST